MNTKKKLRKIMKTMTIANLITEGQVSFLKGDLWAPLKQQARALNASFIPDWCWSCDKPKLDKRRYRRYQRSFKCLSHTVINSSDTSAATEGVVSLKPSDI